MSDDFRDFEFELTDVRVDGSKPLFGKDCRQLRASLRTVGAQGPMGVAVRLPFDGWTRKAAAENYFVWWGRLGVEPLGEETTRLAAQYGPIDGNCVATAFECEAVVNADIDPRRVESEALDLKLFFNPEGDDPALDDYYGELNLRLDVAGRRAELNEKDPEYRPAVAAWLSSGAPQ